MVCSNDRVFKALARDGIAATKEGPVYRVRLAGESTEASAEILLPDTLPLDSKAVKQLVSFASVRHPAGGEVRAAFATPDFHPGSIWQRLGAAIILSKFRLSKRWSTGAELLSGV